MEKKQTILISAGRLKEERIVAFEHNFKFHLFNPVKHLNKNLDSIGEWDLLYFALDFTRRVPIFGEEKSNNLKWLRTHDLSKYNVIYHYRKFKYKNLLNVDEYTPDFRIKHLGKFTNAENFFEMVKDINAKELAGEVELSEVSITVENSSPRYVEEFVSHEPTNVLQTLEEMKEFLNHSGVQHATLRKRYLELKKTHDEVMKERDELQKEVKKLIAAVNAGGGKKTDELKEEKTGVLNSFKKHVKRFANIKKKEEETENKRSEKVEPTVQTVKSKKGVMSYDVRWTADDGSKHVKKYPFPPKEKVIRINAWNKAVAYKEKLLGKL